MTWYLYHPQVAKDGDTAAIAKSGSAQVFAPDDFDGVSPLSAYSTEGIPLDFIEVGGDGLVQAFLLEDAPECLWISGQYRVPLISFLGLFEDAEAAKVAAEEAAVSAADSAAFAAANSSLPPGGTPGQFLVRNGDVSGGEWVTVTPGSGGSSISGAPSVWPTTFPPSGHSHVVNDLSNALSFVKQALTATTAQGFRTAIGAGTGNGTSDLTLGSGPTQAMPGNKVFTAGEIALTAVSGLTATNVQTAVAELRGQVAAGGSGSGTGTTLDVLYSSGSYPTQAGSPPAGVKVRHFYGPVQYTGAAWSGVLDLYDWAPL